MDDYKLKLWNEFCHEHSIADIGVSLFSSTSNIVNVVEIGRTQKRLVLQRSEMMEALVIQEVKKVLDDHEKESGLYEGLIYMMYRLDSKQVIPLYIGKSEKYGKSGGNLSANIDCIEKNKGKFCRWGHQYAYHIGDLSAVVCNNHQIDKQRPKYQKWTKKLFKEFPSDKPQLNFPVYFWITAWKKGSVGIWEEFGPTNLTFLEYLLIGIASDLFPDDLLNDEGVNRP